MTRWMRVGVASAVLGIGLGFAAAGPALGADEQAKTVPLAAHPAVGDTASYVYTCELRQEPTGKFGQAFYVDYTLEFDTKVKSVGEKYTDVDVVFTRIKIDSTLGACDTDSAPDQDQSNLVIQAFRPAIGPVYKVRLDTPTMRIIGTTGPQQGTLPDMMIQLYERILGDKHLSESLQPAFRLKGDPSTASIDEKWTKTLQRNANVGYIEIRLDYQLHDVTDNVATVDIGGEHTVQVDHDTPVSQHITEQHVIGQASWNVEAGVLEDFSLEKGFTLAAGDEKFDLGAKILEREHLERRR